MLSLIKDHVSDAAAPFIFVGLFLVIVGASLWLTLRPEQGLLRRHAGGGPRPIPEKGGRGG